ncbi:hypothetical protein RRF57_002859 [Xylaria bambusicola]|uniref:Uncharacterized protein n=1 Tax=Xylaria bambusicola TaxID=326684 RepID=A0AAN7UDR4_9PEZI
MYFTTLLQIPVQAGNADGVAGRKDRGTCSIPLWVSSPESIQIFGIDGRWLMGFGMRACVCV